MNSSKLRAATFGGAILLSIPMLAHAQNATGSDPATANATMAVGNSSTTDASMSASGQNSVATTTTEAAPASTTENTPVTTTTTTEKHGFDLGWLGLIGLAGLLGLRKPKPNILDSGNDRTTTRP